MYKGTDRQQSVTAEVLRCIRAQVPVYIWALFSETAQLEPTMSLESVSSATHGGLRGVLST